MLGNPPSPVPGASRPPQARISGTRSKARRKQHLQAIGWGGSPHSTRTAVVARVVRRSGATGCDCDHLRAMAAVSLCDGVAGESAWKNALERVVSGKSSRRFWVEGIVCSCRWVSLTEDLLSDVLQMRFGEGETALEATSMEVDVKKHDRRPPGDAPVLASGVHPRS